MERAYSPQKRGEMVDNGVDSPPDTRKYRNLRVKMGLCWLKMWQENACEKEKNVIYYIKSMKMREVNGVLGLEARK